MPFARAAAISACALGSTKAQRERCAGMQLRWLKSMLIRTVLAGSSVTGLMGGGGGALMVSHSCRMSGACARAGSAMAAAALASATMMTTRPAVLSDVVTISSLVISSLILL